MLVVGSGGAAGLISFLQRLRPTPLMVQRQ
jgi:hypothetical protein